jgi:hypothetical protein
MARRCSTRKVGYGLGNDFSGVSKNRVMRKGITRRSSGDIHKGNWRRREADEDGDKGGQSKVIREFCGIVYINIQV